MHFPIPDSDEVQQKLKLAAPPTHFATGGFKAVIEMKNEQGAPEALKTIFIPTAQNEEEKLRRSQLLARAKREILALGECKSPAIVKLASVKASLQRFGSADYLVYSEELLPGQSLVSQAQQGSPRMDMDSLRLLFLTLVQLIKDLHNLGYLHRDIKPDNVMDTNDADRRFVLLDMGIAYKFHGTDITQGPNPPGTLRFMAPELLGPNYRDSMDFRSDLYSAGLTVYVLAAQQHPFAPHPENPYATVYRIMNIQPEPLAKLRRDLPEAFCNIVDRCIKKRSALRYNNLDLVESDIRKV